MGDAASAPESTIFGVVPSLRPGQLWLSVSRDLDFATEAQASTELRAALDSSEWTDCVIDAAGVFIDVRGLGVLLEGAAFADDLGRELLVVAPRSLRVMWDALELGTRLVLLNPSANGTEADGGGQF